MTLLQPGQPAPPAPPALPPLPPATPVPGGVRIVVPGAGGGQLIAQDARSLRARRSELSDQLQSATSRRNELAREIRRSEPTSADRAGLEARMQQLDQRILQLEGDLAETGRLIALAPSEARTTQPARPPRSDRPSRDVGPMAIVFAFVLLLPFAWGAARSIFFRRPAPRVAPVADEESRERLARLEMAVDAIAIEMERVAEGQRFVTRLLSEPGVAQAIAANGDAGRRQVAHVPADPGAR